MTQQPEERRWRLRGGYGITSTPGGDLALTCGEFPVFEPPVEDGEGQLDRLKTIANLDLGETALLDQLEALTRQLAEVRERKGRLILEALGERGERARGRVEGFALAVGGAEYAPEEGAS